MCIYHIICMTVFFDNLLFDTQYRSNADAAPERNSTHIQPHFLDETETIMAGSSMKKRIPEIRKSRAMYITHFLRSK